MLASGRPTVSAPANFSMLRLVRLVPVMATSYRWSSIDVLLPNARPELLPEAEARHERTLEAVRCKPLILIEAPSSAYPSGMLVVGTVIKKRRRPHAILHETAQSVLRY